MYVLSIWCWSVFACQGVWVGLRRGESAQEKDTVAEQCKDNEEDGKNHSSVCDSAPGLDAIVHDHVPVLTSQDLHTDTIICLD